MRALAAGFLGALAATGVQAVLRFTVSTPFAPEQMAQRLFAWIPMGLFSALIGLLGLSAKWLAFGAMVAAYVALGTLGGPLVVRTGVRYAPVWVVASALLQGFVLQAEGRVPWQWQAASLGSYLLSCAVYVGLCLVAAGRRQGRLPAGAVHRRDVGGEEHGGP